MFDHNVKSLLAQFNWTPAIGSIEDNSDIVLSLIASSSFAFADFKAANEDENQRILELLDVFTNMMHTGFKLYNWGKAASLANTFLEKINAWRVVRDENLERYRMNFEGGTINRSGFMHSIWSAYGVMTYTNTLTRAFNNGRCESAIQALRTTIIQFGADADIDELAQFDAKLAEKDAKLNAEL